MLQQHCLWLNKKLDVLLFVTGPPSGDQTISGESITSKISHQRDMGLLDEALPCVGIKCCIAEWASASTLSHSIAWCAHMSVVMCIRSSQRWNVGTRVETQDTWYEYGSDIWMEWLLKTQATCYRLVVSCFKVTDLYLETRQCLSHAEHVEAGSDIRGSGTEYGCTALSLHAILM
jgi:hypothetical protein